MASARVLPASYNTHTYGDATRDYQVGEMTTWESDHTIDLAIANKGEVLDCYDDAASFAESGIVITGATNVTSTRFRVIRAPSGQCHDGTPNNGFTISSTATSIIFMPQENYFQLHDLILIKAVNSADNYATVSNSADYYGFRIVGCLVKGTNSGAGAGRGISLSGNSNLPGNLAIDCLAYECKSFGIAVIAANGTYSYALNCNAINSGNGFTMSWQAGGNCTLTNCIAQDNASGDFVSSNNANEIVTYCLSKDGTADDWDGTHGSGNNLISKDLTFNNEAGDDWHLAATDTDAIGAGTDLSATFDDDIDFTVRSSWDIGFDEYVATGAINVTVLDTLTSTDVPVAILGTLSVSLSDTLTSTDIPTADIVDSFIDVTAVETLTMVEALD